MKNTDPIKEFVRKTLGCECPDSVFESIDVSRQVNIGTGITLRNRIVVGKRLLIYIVEAKHIDNLNDGIKHLILNGKNERDSEGYNRFRLVVLNNIKESIEVRVRKAFLTCGILDAKVHLHIVNDKQLGIF